MWDNYLYAQAGIPTDITMSAGHWHAARHYFLHGIPPLPTPLLRLPTLLHSYAPSVAPLITAYQTRLRASPKVHLFCDAV